MKLLRIIVEETDDYGIKTSTERIFHESEMDNFEADRRKLSDLLWELWYEFCR